MSGKEITGPACVVIYGDDMAERIVGPFRSGIEADAWLTHNPQPFVDVYKLEQPEDPPEPEDDGSPIPCGDCGHVHAPDTDCPYVADPATCNCGADHRAEE